MTEDLNRRWAFDTAMQPYRDKFGYPNGVAGSTNPSGNCLLFFSEEILIIYDLGIQVSSDPIRFGNLLGYCEIQPGNYRRTPPGFPFSGDQEQWDDFIGIVAASKVLGTDHRRDILEFGKETYFAWGPLRFRFAYPTRRTVPGEATRDANEWLGRNLAFVAHLHWAADETPNPLFRLAWFFSVALAGLNRPMDQDPWRLSYLLVRTAPDSLFEKLAKLIWSWRLKRSWPDGIPGVRKAYFGNTNHPLATWMKEAQR